MDSAFPSLLRRSSINWGGVELLLSFFGGYSGFTMATVMMYLPYYVIIYPGISNRFYLKRRTPPPSPIFPVGGRYWHNSPPDISQGNQVIHCICCRCVGTIIGGCSTFIIKSNNHYGRICVILSLCLVKNQALGACYQLASFTELDMGLWVGT